MMNYNDFKKELVKDIKDEMALLYPNRVTATYRYKKQ
jgi:hypothetical protein